MEKLVELRENGKIGLKEFIEKKKEIKDWLFSLDYYLKGTRFEESDKD